MAEDILYFAIGSMMNPTSMKLRELKPTSSRPATLIDFKVTFRGPQGMAFAEAQEGQSWDGVLHTVTPTDMEILDKIEMGYNRMPATCRLYNGEVIACTVYTQNPEMVKTLGPEMMKENPPAERYVDIIVRGMREVGVKQEAIDNMLALPSQPRKRVEDFQVLTVPPDTPTWTMQQFRDEAANGRMLSVLNGKVNEYKGPQEGPMWKRTQDNQGKDNTHELARFLWEPLYGTPSCVEEMSAEHRAWTEDFMASMMSRFPGMSSVVAVISDYPATPEVS